jgi:hypothetical protein
MSEDKIIKLRNNHFLDLLKIREKLKERILNRIADTSISYRDFLDDEITKLLELDKIIDDEISKKIKTKNLKRFFDY